MIEAAASLRDAIWGVPLALLLLGAGLYLTALLRGLQFRGLPRALRFAFLERDEAGGDGDLSHYEALTVALASSVGIGNLVAVPLAVAAGGPGALFWMWIAGLLAMATRFAEAVLGVRFRETDVTGLKSGGPMYYLANGIRWGMLGRGLAVVFAVCLVLASLGVGNGVPAHAVAEAVSGAGGVPALVVGAATALLTGLVILRGVRAIGRVTGVLIPAMILAYLGATCWILWTSATPVSELFGIVLDAALGGRAAGSGAAGFTLAQALRHGLVHGAFVGGAGTGTGAIAAAAARTREPVRQALVAMTGTFIDTIVVAGATGLLVVGTGGGLLEAGVAHALPSAVSGFAAGWPETTLLVAFAFSTILAWAYYGERGVRYLLGERAVLPFRLLFIGVMPLGSVMRLEALWAAFDAVRGLMALPNLLGLVVLSGIVVREARGYFGRLPESGGQPSDDEGREKDRETGR